jgi:hypothetical protein
MAPSRKSQREIDRLKGEAADLWEDQREVLERANRVIRAASRHARVEATSRGRDAFDSRVRPAVASGLSAGRGAASAGRERVGWVSAVRSRPMGPAATS